MLLFLWIILRVAAVVVVELAASCGLSVAARCVHGCFADFRTRFFVVVGLPHGAPNLGWIWNLKIAASLSQGFEAFVGRLWEIREPADWCHSFQWSSIFNNSTPIP